MEIKWNNLIALALVLLAVVLALKLPREIGAFLRTMSAIGPGNSPEEQTLGLIAVGLILVTIVSVVKILTHRPDR